MAKKKPIVLDSSGNLQQLQSTDFIGEVDFITAVNGEAGSIVIGTPVYFSAAGTVKKAKADAVGTLPCIGLVADSSISNGVSGSIQADGILVATTGAWDAITGGSGGLVVNTKYFVSTATAGLLTSTPNVSTGYVQEIGIAMSTTEMLISPRQEIKL